MQDLELESLMQETANDAVKTAKEEFDIVLDFTIENVSLVDTTIERFVQNYPSQALDDKAVFTICNMYGAYLGETFRRLAGGKWHYDTSAPEAAKENSKWILDKILTCIAISSTKAKTNKGNIQENIRSLCFCHSLLR